MRALFLTSVLLTCSAFATSAADIVDTAVAAGDFKTLVAAVKAAGLVDTLKGAGPFTVFAPTNAAMAQGTQNKSTLARRMSYLIVPGKYDSQALLRLINEAGGDARMRTAEGGILVARMNGPTNIVVMDEKGNTADIAIYDVPKVAALKETFPDRFVAKPVLVFPAS